MRQSIEQYTRIDRICPICDCEEYSEVEGFGRDGWTAVSCKDCDFIFLSQAPAYDALSEELAWTDQFHREKKRRRKKQPILSWLDRKTRWRLHLFRDNEWEYISEHIATGRVLDVGCGQNNKIPEQFTPYGIEIEKAAANACHKQMTARGGRVVHAPALEGLKQFEDGYFDGMIMRSYLEHELNPKAVLELAFEKLRIGGVIYVKVPNYGTINRMVRGVDWCGVRFPDHLNYFDVSSMRNLASRTGYALTLKNKLTRLTNDNMHVFLIAQKALDAL